MDPAMQQIEIAPRTYRGSCPYMCPEKEQLTRVGHSVSIFERDNNNEPDPNSMVKEYRRAGADQEEPAAEDLRTPKALEATIYHLVHNIVNDPRSKSNDLALDWYDFLWDRFRAVRKDITQQNFCDPASALLVERCSRFHIHSCYAMNRVKDFDIHMNRRNLNDCLQMLRQTYDDLKPLGISCTNEVEFQKYDALLYLDDDPSHLSNRIKRSEYRSSEEIKFVIEVIKAFTTNDFYRFLQLMASADYMTSCILGLYVNQLRLTALKIIISACGTRQTIVYPLQLAMELFKFDDQDDLNEFCAALEIEVNDQSILLKREHLTLLQTAYLPPFKSRRLVEDKLGNSTIGQLIYLNDSALDLSSGLNDSQSTISQHDDIPMHNLTHSTIPQKSIPRFSFLDEPITNVTPVTAFRPLSSTLNSSIFQQPISIFKTMPLTSRPQTPVQPQVVSIIPHLKSHDQGTENEPLSIPTLVQGPTSTPTQLQIQTQPVAPTPTPAPEPEPDDDIDPAKREEIMKRARDIMPAGKFKRLKTASRPTPVGRLTESNKVQKKKNRSHLEDELDELRETLSYEKSINETFFQVWEHSFSQLR